MLSLSKINVGIVLVALAAPGSAGIKDVAQAKNTEPTPIESMARVKKDASQGNTITCWQEGRQIFKSRHIKAPKSNTGGKQPLVIPGRGKSITLMDLTTGLCILETSNDKSQ